MESTRFTRRSAVAGAALLPVAGALPLDAWAGTARVRNAFAALEREYGARLGVFGHDLASGRRVGFRARERFPYCSTYKALAAGALLHERRLRRFEQRITFTRADLVANSPITEQRVDTGMTLLELCDAAIRFSDNTAGNILFAQLGGPKGFQAALRGIGDRVTRADRIETALNTAVPGDPRDTSTPRTLARDLRRYAVSNLLPPRRRRTLNGWLIDNTTGDALIRKVAPKGWTVGDKTGSGERGTRNDIAVLWPPRGRPVVLAVLTTKGTPESTTSDPLVAAAADVALRALGR